MKTSTRDVPARGGDHDREPSLETLRAEV